MILNTYLTFDDNCREVFEFYRSIFGGEFETLMTFREGPEDMNVAEEELDRIMHVSLPIGSSVLMGSDSCSGFGPPPVVGNNFSLSFQAESRDMRTRSSPNCQTAAKRSGQWATCSGAHTSADAPTSSASTGRCSPNAKMSEQHTLERKI